MAYRAAGAVSVSRYSSAAFRKYRMASSLRSRCWADSPHPVERLRSHVGIRGFLGHFCQRFDGLLVCPDGMEMIAESQPGAGGQRMAREPSLHALEEGGRFIGKP